MGKEKVTDYKRRGKRNVRSGAFLLRHVTFLLTGKL